MSSSPTPKPTIRGSGSSSEANQVGHFCALSAHRSGSVRDRIVELVERGSTFGNACRAVGIHPATGRRWLQRDRLFMLGVKLPRIARRIRKLEGSKFLARAEDAFPPARPGTGPTRAWRRRRRTRGACPTPGHLVSKPKLCHQVREDAPAPRNEGVWGGADPELVMQGAQGPVTLTATRRNGRPRLRCDLLQYTQLCARRACARLQE